MNTLDRDIELSTEALKVLLLKNQPRHPPSATKVFEPLLGATEAAGLLNLHPVTLLRWAREGKVPHLRLGKKVMFRASELNAWCISGYSATAVCAA